MAKKHFQRALSVGLSLALCAGMVAPALAVTYDIGEGSVHVERDTEKGVYSYQEKSNGRTDNIYTTDDREIVITGSTTDNHVVVGENVTDTTVILSDATIDRSGTGSIINTWEAGDSAFTIGANSDVVVELDGDNTLKSGVYRASLEITGGASVTVQDKTKAGESGRVAVNKDDDLAILRAGSGTSQMSDYAYSAVGIGTLKPYDFVQGSVEGQGTGGSITIDHSKVIIESDSAAIGAGMMAEVGDIKIQDSVVSATNSSGTAIGAGISGKTGNITIVRSNVSAQSGRSGATGDIGAIGVGIGAAVSGKVGDISIQDSTVTAIGGANSSGSAPGIGASTHKPATWSPAGIVGDITIENSIVDARGGAYQGNVAEGIGKGGYDGQTYGTIGTIEITNTALVGKNNVVTITDTEDGNRGEIEVTLTGDKTAKDIVLNGEENTVTIPEGSKIGESTYENGATIDKDGNVTSTTVSDRDENGNVTVTTKTEKPDGTEENVTTTVTVPEGKEDEVKTNPDSKTELPAGSTVIKTDKDGKTTEETTYLDKATIDKDGKVTTEGGTVTKTDNGDGTTDVTVTDKGGNETEITVPTDKKDDVKVNEDGTIDVPAGGKVKNEDGTETELPFGGKVNPDGTVTPNPDPNAGNQGGGNGVTGGNGEADVIVIDGVEVPLSGLVSVEDVLSVLYRLTEGVDGERDEVVAWAVENGIIDDETDVEELVTVAALRAILANYARAFELDVDVTTLATLTGEDDDIVMNCDEVIDEFFTKSKEDEAA